MAEPQSEQAILNSVYDATAQRLKTDATITVTASDIQIGAVELKDGASDARAVINAANTARTTATVVQAVQHVDAAGNVLSATPVLGAGSAVIGQVNASQVTSPWITNASVVNAPFTVNASQLTSPWVTNASLVNIQQVNASQFTSPWITNASLVTASNVIGKLVDTAGTINGVTLNTLISGEDQTNDVMKTEGQFSYTNVTASGATAVKTTAGLLHAITFNQPVSGVTTVITDASAAGGTLIGTVVNPTGSVNLTPFTLIYDVKCLSGITCSQVSGVATGNNLTVTWR